LLKNLKFIQNKNNNDNKFNVWKEKLRNNINSRIVLMVGLLLFGFFLILLTNNIITNFETGTWLYREARIFPTFPPAGNDFRVGYYRPAHYLIESHFNAIGPDGTYPSNYPPLVAISALPYAFFGATTAYGIHVIVLILANLACMLISIWMVKNFLLVNIGISDLLINIISILLLFIIAIYIFTSYFFLYSLERGNTDILALFYCLLAFLILVKKPNNLWLQVILLSVAVHFKIYPIVLFPILFFKHGKKLILPALIVNLAFLFCLGPNMAWAFLQSMSSGGEGVGIGNAWSNVANHASYSFSIGLENSDEEYLSTPFFMTWAVTFLVPLLIWGITAIALRLATYTKKNAVLLFMVSLPLMSLLPTVSMDYKLVIHGTSIILLLGLILKHFFYKFSMFDLTQVVLLIGLLLMMSRSYAFVDESIIFIRNKYLWVLLLEIFMVVNIFRNLKITDGEDESMMSR